MGRTKANPCMLSYKPQPHSVVLLACSLATLLLGASSATVYGDYPTFVLSGAGPAETSMAVLRTLRLFESRTAVPVRFNYRVTSSVAAREDLINDVTTLAAPSAVSNVHFAISEAPLNATERSAFTSNPDVGDSVHVPLFVTPYALYYNIPGNRARSLNLTACLVRSIFEGEITDWSNPNIKDINPNYVSTDLVPTITVLVEDVKTGATQALIEYINRACPKAAPFTYASMSAAARQVGSGMISALQSTFFSIGYALVSAGRAASLPELALQNAKGAFIVSSANNATNLRAALAAPELLPTTLTGNYATVSVANVNADSVHPMLRMAYLVTKRDWRQGGSVEAQKGELLHALMEFFYSSAVSGTDAKAGLLADYNLLSIGDAAIAAVKPMIDNAALIAPGSIPYTLSDSTAANAVSSSRITFDVAAYADMMAAISSLRMTVASTAPRVLRGAGSSAVSLFMYKVMSELRARSTSPVHMVYRATGSGGGQTEFVAKDTSYVPLVDFGASDTPLSDTLYTELASKQIRMTHVPIMLAPMNFFVQFPDGVLPGRKLKLSGCTLAKIFQADITSWAAGEVAADNGFALPDKPITVFYRSSSGTTAVITEYLSRACPDSWRLGSGNDLAGKWPATAKSTLNAAGMSAAVQSTPYSIGYMDVGYGYEANLVEVAVKNKDGNYVTAQDGDVGAAVTQLFKSDAWPKDPTRSYASVSILNQPGERTFPIVAMPFMFVRTDLISRGDSGPLLVAFLNFMLDNSTQSSFLPPMGFTPLPFDVRKYVFDRTFPLLTVDTKARTWVFETSRLSRGQGSNDNVFSSFANNYENSQSSQFADFLVKYSASANAKAGANSTNGTGTGTVIGNLSGLADVPANLKARLDDMDDQMAILQSIAIAGIVFGIIGLALAIFTSCRMFVHSSLWGAASSAGIVHPGSITMGSSVRRQKSQTQLSEGSFR